MPTPISSFFKTKDLKVLYYQGHLTLPDAGVISNAAALAEYLSGQNIDAQSLVKLLAGSTGMFAFAVAANGKVYLACDIIRSIPLFVVKTPAETYIADHIGPSGPLNGSLRLNENRLMEFLASGYVYAGNTVYEGVYGLQAGELLTLGADEHSSVRYFRYCHHPEKTDVSDIDKFSEELHHVLLSVFRRLLDQTPEVNRWIVPLSGGHDSRLVVNYLHRLGVKNVVCFSYGIPGNEQSEISHQVAQALGYEWHFVEYTEQKWLALHQNGLADAYLEYAFNGVCTPHLQDFLAVYELKQNGIIQQGDVFVTGHSHDFLTGSGIMANDHLCNTPGEAVQQVMKNHIHAAGSKYLEKKIWQIFDQNFIEPEHFQEFFNWQELQAKKYLGMSRTYGFFGFERRLPLWDRQLVDFWLKVPRHRKLGRKLLLEIEANGFHPEQIRHIPFARMAGTVKEHPVKVLLKKALPAGLIVRLLRIFKSKVKISEGLTQIYALKAPTVGDLVAPITDWPSAALPFIRPMLPRLSYQLGHSQLTALYTIRKIVLDNDKK